MKQLNAALDRDRAAVLAGLRHLFEQHTVSGSSSAIGPGILGAVGEAIGDTTIAMKMLAGIGDVDSAEPSYAMWAMSRKI